MLGQLIVKGRNFCALDKLVFVTHSRCNEGVSLIRSFSNLYPVTILCTLYLRDDTLPGFFPANTGEITTLRLSCTTVLFRRNEQIFSVRRAFRMHVLGISKGYARIPASLIFAGVSYRACPGGSLPPGCSDFGRRSTFSRRLRTIRPRVHNGGLTNWRVYCNREHQKSSYLRFFL